MKVVINKCFGGFNLSTKAFEELIKLGWTVTEYTSDGHYYKDKSAKIVRHIRKPYGDYSFVGSDYEPEFRTNPDIIKIVEMLGEKANGKYAELKIVEIPDGTDFIIKEYDGSEHIAEKHRTWS